MNKSDVNSQKLISKTIDDFNFNIIHDYMKSVNWKWSIPENDTYKRKIPSLDEIKQNAKHLLESAFNNSNDGDISIVGSGGFVAKFYIESGVMPMFELSFQIQHSECTG